ncbi:MAG: cupin domain-containing protein [Dehalococcoidia bacterium]
MTTDVRAARGAAFPYQDYMRDEGIPLFEEVAGVADVTALPREPWARTGGLGTFMQLRGSFQAERGLYVAEIPGGQALNPEHHVFEEEIFILQGRGLIELSQGDGPKISFEWGEGSVFAIPKNVTHRLVNGSRDPVLFMSVNMSPYVINAIDDIDFVYNSDKPMFDLYGEGKDYFNPSDVRTTGRYDAVVWHTNFIPDVRGALLDDLEQKVSGGQLTGYVMGKRFPMGHISEWPSGRYHKAHFHGPGAILLGLDGEGYVLVWPSELGAHPYKDGHGDEVMKVIWGRNSIYCPPNSHFHQHFNTSAGPAKHVAVYGGRVPLGVGHLQKRERTEEEGYIGFESFRTGGTLIDYDDEDPKVRADFTAELEAKGIKVEMPPVTYRAD